MNYTTRQIADWRSFERVRQSGSHNMFDHRRGRETTGLPREEYLFCIQHYAELKAAAAGQNGCSAHRVE